MRTAVMERKQWVQVVQQAGNLMPGEIVERIQTTHQGMMEILLRSRHVARSIEELVAVRRLNSQIVHVTLKSAVREHLMPEMKR